MARDDLESEQLNLELVRGWFDTFVEQRCICQYCGFDGSRTSGDWVQLQGDHLIPRHIAGQHSEDALNRVIACYYCNSIKRDFDPAAGKLVAIPNGEVQRELIETVRGELKKRKDRTWQYGGGLHSSYEFMMRRLRP